MGFYEELEAFMTSVSKEVMGGEDTDPESWGKIARDETGHVTLGPYRIPQQEWNQLAEDAGIQGAPWYDQYAQKAVVRHQFARLYNQYDGRWDAVAVAWEAGEDAGNRAAAGEPLHRMFSDKDQSQKIQKYVNNIVKGARMAAAPTASGDPVQDTFARNAISAGPFANAALVDERPPSVRMKPSAESVITEVLTSMRNKQVARAPEEVEDAEVGE